MKKTRPKKSQLFRSHKKRKKKKRTLNKLVPPLASPHNFHEINLQATENRTLKESNKSNSTQFSLAYPNLAWKPEEGASPLRYLI